jgi:hypothetical protein
VIKAGDWVTLAKLPTWVSELPSESQEVIRFCLGRTFRVEEIDERGQVVLDVSQEADQRFGGFRNDIRVEPEYVELALRPPRFDG